MTFLKLKIRSEVKQHITIRKYISTDEVKQETNTLYKSFKTYWNRTGIQNDKKKIKIKGQTTRKFQQQQMKTFFYCTTLLYMLYGTEIKRRFIKNIICLNRQITHQCRLCIFFKVNLVHIWHQWDQWSRKTWKKSRVKQKYSLIKIWFSLKKLP